jgi:hypothetical protein
MRTIVYYLLLAISFLVVFRGPEIDSVGIERRYLQVDGANDEPDVKEYNQVKIERAAPKLNSFVPRLLVFNGDHFMVYNLKHNATLYHDVLDFNNRPVMIVPMLVHALSTHFPQRFARGMPPFQMLFTESDSLRTDCVNDRVTSCSTQDWPPILVFGSLMKDAAQTFPSAKLMPVPPFVECLYKYRIRGEKDCEWAVKTQESNVPMRQLKPTVIWRGSDYAFLFQYAKFRFKDISDVVGADVQNLTKQDVAVRIFQNWNEIGPRWRAIALTLQAEIEQKNLNEPIWLDSKFSGVMPGLSQETLDHFSKIGVHVHAVEMSPELMSKYRYQIDYGGGGGTTWSGTLSKLSMPGVLLHHETPTMDWFHKEMVAWKHYLPVNWDLTDLRAKYDWAEANIDKISEISREATKLSNYLLSIEYMQKTYQDLFVDYLAKVVRAYCVQHPSWESAMHRYKKMGFDLEPLATCDALHCTVRAERIESASSSRTLRHVPTVTTSLRKELKMPMQLEVNLYP